MRHHNHIDKLLAKKMTGSSQVTDNWIANRIERMADSCYVLTGSTLFIFQGIIFQQIKVMSSTEMETTCLFKVRRRPQLNCFLTFESHPRSLMPADLKLTSRYDFEFYWVCGASDFKHIIPSFYSDLLRFAINHFRRQSGPLTEAAYRPFCQYRRNFPFKNALRRRY